MLDQQLSPPVAAASRRTAFFTICSNNYIPFARTLMDSIHIHHPDADLFVCLADEPVAWPGLYDGDFTMLRADTLGIAGFRSMAFQYDIMEFNTALKPFVFSHLLEVQQYRQVIYLDPDIRLYARLDRVLDALSDGASFVLTPHLHAPAEIGADPDDIGIMRAGVYNLGFLAARRCDETLPLIHWWMRRLRMHCVNAQNDGLFVDQKFMDLIPGFSRAVHILHDPAYNLAYWNIDQAVLAQADGRFTVDGQPLAFFHFSGFDPRRPDVLSKHSQNFRDATRPALTALCRHYAETLLQKGWGTIPAALYAYGQFNSGTAIHPLIRRMYRLTTPDWPHDPFETYEAYLHEAAPGGNRDSSSYVLTHFLKFLKSYFPNQAITLDLRRLDDLRHQINWYVRHGRREQGLDHRLIAPVARRLGARAFADSSRARGGPADRPAVTVIGYLKTTSGVGVAGRQLLDGLAQSRFKVDALDVAVGVVADRSEQESAPHLTGRVSGRVQIFAVNADQLAAVAEHVQALTDATGYRISVPFWELEEFPEPWLAAFDLVDEIWAPTAWVQTMLVRRLDKPVLHMPPPLTLPCVPDARRETFGLPDDVFLFYTAFDFLSFMERKNPKGCIAAIRTLRRSQGPAARLVIKTMNASLAPAAFAELQALIEQDDSVILIDRVLSRTETLQLTACCDAVLSLHRCEGLGLMVTEAMALRRPVIATDYSATTEFITRKTGYPVAYTLVPVKPGEYPMHAGQLWAEPDYLHAAWLMQRVMTDAADVADKVDAAAWHLSRRYGAEAAQARQVQRLAELSVVAP